MIQFSAQSAYLLCYLKGGRLFGTGRLFLFSEKQPNVQSKTLIYLFKKEQGQERCTSIAEVMGWIPVQAWIFFGLAFSSTP